MPNSLKTKLSKLRHKGQITNEEYQELITKLDGHDAEIRADERAKVLNETRMFVDKHSVEIGKREGIREFAKLLKKKFNEFIDYDDNGEQTFESNPDLVWGAIDEVLSEYEKEQK